MSVVQSKKEEYFNALTHGLGIILSIVGLIVFALTYDDEKISFGYLLIYSFSMIILYSASTLYHIVENKKKKNLLRKFDHISIYFLIAGTYTPICVSVLKESRGFLILGLVWGITLIGLILKIFFTGKFEKLSLLLYLVMGWLIVMDIQILYDTISRIELIFFILGGAFYTLGVVFYVMHKLKYHHVIWHVFVLLGSLFHYLMIYCILN